MRRVALVVDDEPNIRLTIAAILEGRGFAVQTAPDALTAIDTLTSSAVDVVITDLKMETDTAGFDAADVAARQRPRPITIIVSAYPQLATDWAGHGVSAFF